MTIVGVAFFPPNHVLVLNMATLVTFYHMDLILFGIAVKLMKMGLQALFKWLVATTRSIIMAYLKLVSSPSSMRVVMSPVTVVGTILPTCQ
jgi:hypothetical protein